MPATRHSVPAAAKRRAGMPNIIARAATPRSFSPGERACSTADGKDNSPQQTRAATSDPHPKLIRGYFRDRAIARTVGFYLVGIKRKALSRRSVLLSLVRKVGISDKCLLMIGRREGPSERRKPVPSPESPPQPAPHTAAPHPAKAPSPSPNQEDAPPHANHSCHASHPE